MVKNCFTVRIYPSNMKLPQTKVQENVTYYKLNFCLEGSNNVVR